MFFEEYEVGLSQEKDTGGHSKGDFSSIFEKQHDQSPVLILDGIGSPATSPTKKYQTSTFMKKLDDKEEMRQRNDGQTWLFTSRDKAVPHLGKTHDVVSPEKIGVQRSPSVERDSRLISDDLPNLQEIFQQKMKWRASTNQHSSSKAPHGRSIQELSASQPSDHQTKARIKQQKTKSELAIIRKQMMKPKKKVLTSKSKSPVPGQAQPAKTGTAPPLSSRAKGAPSKKQVTVIKKS